VVGLRRRPLGVIGAPAPPRPRLSPRNTPRAALHEDVERLERLIVKDLKQEAIRSHKDKLMQSHRVRKRLDTMQDSARKLVGPSGSMGRRSPRRGPHARMRPPAQRSRVALHRAGRMGPPLHAHCPRASLPQVKIYEDDDDARREEIAALAGVGGNPFGAFYERLREVRDYYKRFPSTDITEVRSGG
jgi:splicing factor 3A subunit 3